MQRESDNGAMKRRICVFCETWESGGIESFLCSIFSEMDLKELEIDIVVTELSDSIYTEPLKRIGISFRQLSGHKYKFWKNYQSFYRLLKDRRYDVLHLNAFQALSLIYLFLGKMVGVPVRIAHSHNTDLRNSKTRAVKILIHRFFRYLLTGTATEYWSCSEAAGCFMFRLNENKCRFIPNGINIERFRFRAEIRNRVREEHGWENHFVIGCVGRLCSQKNQEFLLKVCASALHSCPNSLLLLVGEGEDRMKLEQKTQELGISDSVVFFGVSVQVEQLYWAMDAFAIPSRFEGLGIVAIEAQAAGLSPVCSEFVPDEVFLPGLARKCSLTAGPDAWAKMLRETPEHSENAATLVARAGYSVKNVTNTVFQCYMGIFS